MFISNFSVEELNCLPSQSSCILFYSIIYSSCRVIDQLFMEKNVLLHKVQYYLFPFLPPFYLFICSGAQLITVFSLNKNKLEGSSVQEYAILFWTNEWERLCKGIGEKEESKQMRGRRGSLYLIDLQMLVLAQPVLQVYSLFLLLVLTL